MLTLEELEDLNHIRLTETQLHSPIATICSSTTTGSGKSEHLTISGKFLKECIDQTMDGLEH